ncbi:MAG: hypothetical protein ACRERE_11905 [Candidatus Entotheonellia bacterium]
MISTPLSALALTSCVLPGTNFGLGLIDLRALPLRLRALPLRAFGLQSSAPPVTSATLEPSTTGDAEEQGK